MTLETLRLYRDVVRLRSFSRGAATNGVSQSAASQAIQQLEAELDALLDTGVRIVGGCCGSTPDHIRLFRKVIDEHVRKREGAS